MAPIRDTTRADVLGSLAGDHPEQDLPKRIFYQNAPLAEVREEDGAWLLRELVLNKERAKAGFEQASAQGQGFRPESYWAFYEPRRVILEARSPRSLRAALRLVPWPLRPGLRNIAARGLAALSG